MTWADINDIVREAKEEESNQPAVEVGDCPMGGDTSNDCEGCVYGCDYQFNSVTGRCKERVW